MLRNDNKKLLMITIAALLLASISAITAGAAMMTMNARDDAEALIIVK